MFHWPSGEVETEDFHGEHAHQSRKNSGLSPGFEAKLFSKHSNGNVRGLVLTVYMPWYVWESTSCMILIGYFP